MMTLIPVALFMTRCSQSVPIPDSGTLVLGATWSPIPGCPATDRPRNDDLSPSAGGLPDAVTSALTAVAFTVPDARFRPCTVEVTSPDTVAAVATPSAVSLTVPLVSTPGIVTDAAALVLVFPFVPRQASGCGNSSPAMTVLPTFALAP